MSGGLRRVLKLPVKALLKQELIIVAGCLIIGLSIWSYHTPRQSHRQVHNSRMQLSFNSQTITPQPQGPGNLSPLPSRQEAIWSQPLPSVWHGSTQPVASSPALAPILTKIPTTEPVVFLGIDDGWFKLPEVKDWLTEHRLPFTLFLVNDGIKDNYDYFRQLQSAGMTIQNHTLTHPDLNKLTLEQQQAEICGAADTYSAIFGRRPTLLRPPYGEVSELTRQAAASCGMKAIIMWHAKANGGSMQFQDDNQNLQPGDIVLMHFRPEFLKDMKAFIDQVSKDHLQIGRLEDWLP